MKTKNFQSISLATAAILCIPLIAMQFTEEVQWSLGDFIIAGVMLLGVGFLINFLLTFKAVHQYRYFLIIIAIILFLLLWAELAVGIFGSPFAGS